MNQKFIDNSEKGEGAAKVNEKKIHFPNERERKGHKSSQWHMTMFSMRTFMFSILLFFSLKLKFISNS